MARLMSLALLALSLALPSTSEAGIFRNRCNGCQPIRNTVYYVSHPVQTSAAVVSTTVRTTGAIITAPIRILCNGGCCGR